MGKIVFAHPLWLWALIFVIPALAFIWYKTSTIESKSIRQRVRIRSIFFSAAWFNLVVAAAGISWGSYLVGVQKSSKGVAMVFDVSNSMLAEDTKNGASRLKTAQEYARLLMEKSEGTSFSVILAKGDGITAVPLTQDYQLIDSLLEVLSPNLMSAPGTSLYNGIQAALDSFPQNFSYAPHIWVFTDGEETESRLENAMTLCMEKGVPLTIIGFGSTEGCDIFTGDGTTVIHSAMQKNTILSKIQSSQAKMGKSFEAVYCSFVEAEEKGSAAKLLSPLKADSSQNINQSYSAFETRDRPRFKLFLVIALFWLVTGIFVSEKRRFSLIFQSLLIMMIFTGCSESKNLIAEGCFDYHNSNYNSAISKYKTVIEKSETGDSSLIRDYALFNLGTTYLAEGETAAALEKYHEIFGGESESTKAGRTDDSISTDEKIIFAVLYNLGVVAYESGNFDKARGYFKEALKIDSTDLQAKINLELCISKNETMGRQNENTMTKASENNKKASGGENSLFEHIKENDKKQWKNSESKSDTDLSKDY